jgi:trimethylamine:corrinoid methyltransferase-like protein
LGLAGVPPHVVEANGERRDANMEDQNTFCKLAQTSPYLDLVAGSMAVASDFPADIAAAKMLISCFTLTDTPSFTIGTLFWQTV